MKISNNILTFAVLCTAAIAGTAAVQGTQQPAKAPAGASTAQQPTKPGAAVEAAMAAPKPMPEHAQLQKNVGTWDATVSMMMPGMPPQTSTGTMVIKSIGGMWTTNDFTGTVMGGPFVGHGVDGYDPAKKKFVSTWVDSMSTNLGVSEGTYDAATKTLTMTGQMPDMTGKLVLHKMVTEMKDADTMVFHIYAPGPDGKEAEGLKIEYKRRK